MTEVSITHHSHHACSPSKRDIRNHSSEIETILKSDQNSTASTSSITSGSSDSPSSSLFYSGLNSHDDNKASENRNVIVNELHNPEDQEGILRRSHSNIQRTKSEPEFCKGTSKQVLIRPKAHVLTGNLNTSLDLNPAGTSAKDGASASEPCNPTVDTKGLNHATNSPGSSAIKSVHTAVPKAIAPVPIVVRPAPLKNTGSLSIKKNLNNIVEVQQKVVSNHSQQYDEEDRKKLIRLQQQIQKREAAARQNEERLLRKKKQQDQCNFPNIAITDSNILQNNRPHYRTTMGSASNQQHSNQVQVMTQQPQGYAVDASHLIHSHNGSHHPESLDSGNHPTPLFERLVTEEVQEMKTHVRMIESLSRKISEMQNMQDDLESRLEKSTKEKLEMENQLESLNQVWVKKCGDVEDERDVWAKRYGDERARNARLSDLVNRKDKEIQRMIQRKYDSRGQGHGHGHGNHMKRSESSRGSSSQQANTKSVSTMMQGMSPHDILVERGSMDAIRERNALHSLLDFFGM